MNAENIQTPESWLVTGALGCIGAWVVRRLVKEGAAVTVFDLAADPGKPASLHRLRLILDDEELSRVRFVQGDIGELPAVEKVVRENAITHIIHLAALQVPFCKADSFPGGARQRGRDGQRLRNRQTGWLERPGLRQQCGGLRA